MKKALFILGKLHERDIDWFVAAGQRERVVAGTVLIEEGKPVDVVYILLDGRLTVTSGSPRQLLGELGLFALVQAGGVEPLVVARVLEPSGVQQRGTEELVVDDGGRRIGLR